MYDLKSLEPQIKILYPKFSNYKYANIKYEIELVTFTLRELNWNYIKMWLMFRYVIN